MRYSIIIYILLFSSCLTLNDSWIDLGDGYTYHIDGKHKSIYPRQGYYNTEIYSTIKNYNFNDKYIIAKQNPDYEYYKLLTTEKFCVRFAIYCNYLKDSTSKQFLEETTPFIRKSIKSDSSFYKFLKLKGVTNKNSTEDWDKINPILDSIFHSDSFYVRIFNSIENYWIIDKDNNVRYGPLTLAEFDRLRNEKTINLRFKK